METTKAKWVADLMKADGITAKRFAAMSQADQVNAALAYLDAVRVKIANMQNQLLTRPQMVPAFRSVVLSIL